MADETDPLYLTVAGELSALIASGQLPPRSRVPSVRQLASQRRISVNTAVATLRLLEQRGLIEARERSGYFVAPRRAPPPEPAAVSLPRTPQLAGARAMLKRLAEASLDPASVRLGEAIPDPALFPTAALRASLARVSRRQPELFGAYPRRMGGSLALRRQIAGHYGRLGARLDAAELVITNGCTEALMLALRAVAAPGDTIAVESPTYYGFLQLAEDLGIKVLEVPMHARDGVSLPALRELLGARGGRGVRAFVTIGNFSNPTGAMLPEARKRELVRLCREADIALIEDDIYGDLALDGSRPRPCKAFDTDGRVLLCSSFTKSLSPGARIGFMAPGRRGEEVRALKQMFSGATAVQPQEVLADYLASGRYARHLVRLRARLAAQVQRLAQSVQDHFPSGTRISRPQGGYVLWVELPGEVDTMRLLEQSAGKGIHFVPGALFSASGRYGNCLRLNAGYPFTPATDAAVAQLGALVAAGAG